MGQALEKAAVRGTTILITAVRRIVTTTRAIIVTTISVFGLYVSPPALFYARVGRWESVERAFKESRPVPVMLIASENTPELVSLVSLAETLADSIKF